MDNFLKIGKIKSALFFLFLFNFCFSQTHRFIYELNKKTDSTQDHYKKENVVLDITGNEVQYYESYAMVMDSINNRSPFCCSFSYNSIARLKRKLASDTNNNYYFLDEDYYVFQSNDPIVWKLDPETKTQGEWKLQKATAIFGGRTWEAWFTNDIPFPEGPYKFKGLPGLVIEIWDSKNNFHFELAKIEIPKNPNTNIVETLFSKKTISVSFEKYSQPMLNYYNDPHYNFRNMEEGTWSIGITDGTETKTKDGLNKVTKELQEDWRKNNNPIELDKAIKYPVK
jgi:GLPGLI family protein